MKKFTILLLIISILTINSGIIPAYAAIRQDSTSFSQSAILDISSVNRDYANLSDPELHQLIRDNIYASLESEYEEDTLIVENISTTYVSKEYLEELAYNSKSNVFFGYTLAELDEQFEGQKYVFTLGENGQTTVKAYEELSDGIYKKVIKNVAIGAGIILINVTASLILANGVTAPISMIFAASALKGSTMAVKSAVIGGLYKGLVTGIQTGDFDEALEAAALGASEGFKVGAIVGSLVGGGQQAYNLYSASTISTSAIPTPRESELRVLKMYGGEEQLSYLNGEEVGYFTDHASRPDVVRPLLDGTYEAIEVKNYNLAGNSYHLVEKLSEQIYKRTVNLPSGYSQRVVLDVAGRGYSTELINGVINEIQEACSSFYPNLPVDVVW